MAFYPELVVAGFVGLVHYRQGHAAVGVAEGVVLQGITGAVVAMRLAPGQMNFEKVRNCRNFTGKSASVQ